MVQKSQALVIGASMAGLVCAEILSRHFEQVTVIERDTFSEKPEPRKGTPQANHVHIMLVRGKKHLAEIFPKIEFDFEEAGCIKFDFINDGAYLVPTGWTPNFKSDLITIAGSRTLIESVVRNRVKQNKKIDFLEGQTVTGLLERDSAITGVKTRTTEIAGDFVVDASGRTSNLPLWLEELGYSQVEESSVDADIGYATRYYTPTEQNQKDHKVIVILNRPPTQSKMGGLSEIEDGKWIVTMYGIGGDYPPTDEKGFFEFAKNLADTRIFDEIKKAEPVSEIFGYRVKGSRMRHYEKMSKWPENFIALGDSVCTFNPFYAQGMTVSILASVQLDKMLAEQKDLKGFSKKFQNALYKVNSYPWILATGEDFRWSNTIGKKPGFLTRLIQKYVDRVLLLSPSSKHATLAFQQMMQMVKSPTVTFHPAIFFHQLFKKF